MKWSTDTDDAFFNRNWARGCWNRWAGTGTVARPGRWVGPLALDAVFPCKTSNKGGSTGIFPLVL